MNRKSNIVAVRMDSHKGLTLVELLVALVVTSIVLTAVATLAFAVSSANDASDDTSEKQAQLRYASLRVSELVRNCKLICSSSSDDLAVWRADDNDDGKININELVYLECGSGSNRLRLCEFPVINNSPISLGTIGALSTNWWQVYSSDITYTNLIPQCSNVQFYFDVGPPDTRAVAISFEIQQRGVSHDYQISSVLRGRAGYLLDAGGEIVASDDD
jgi:prepilin-type N-terminal cleavage/methylation domain-containing protein